MLDLYRIEWERINFDRTIVWDFSSLSGLPSRQDERVFFGGMIAQPYPWMAEYAEDYPIEAFVIFTLEDIANLSYLLNEALIEERCGKPWGIATNKASGNHMEGVQLLAVGDEVSEDEYHRLKDTPGYHVIGFERGPFLRTWFMTTKKPNNPLEVRFSWHPRVGGNSQIRGLWYEGWTQENLEEVRLMMLQQETRMGRRPGPAVSSEKLREMVLEAYRLHEEGLEWSLAARNVDASRNALLKYRKDFLRNLMPEVNRMRRQDMTRKQIAKELEMSPKVLGALIDDARKLGIE